MIFNSFVVLSELICSIYCAWIKRWFRYNSFNSASLFRWKFIL